MFQNQKYRSSSITDWKSLITRGSVMFFILGIALTGFEMFNFSTTQYALSDLLGSLSFLGVQWATILAIAFCGIDFAGIGRLFCFDDSPDPTREARYLFIAWLLGATMNAILTWWGVSMALVNHPLQSTAIIDKKLLMQTVPVFVAIMVWVTRVLLIGSFSMAGSRVQPKVEKNANQRVPSYSRPETSTAPRPANSASSSLFQKSPLPPLRQTAPIPPIQRPAPLVTSQTQTSLTNSTRAPLPTPPEPEYIPDEDVPSSNNNGAIPALRPLALSAKPTPNNHSTRQF